MHEHGGSGGETARGFWIAGGVLGVKAVVEKMLEVRIERGEFLEFFGLHEKHCGVLSTVVAPMLEKEMRFDDLVERMRVGLMTQAGDRNAKFLQQVKFLGVDRPGI